MVRKVEIPCAVKHCEKPPLWMKRYCASHRTKRSRLPRPSTECGRCLRSIDLITDGIPEAGVQWHWGCYLKVRI